MSASVRMQKTTLDRFPGRRFRRRKLRSPKPSRCRANLLTLFCEAILKRGANALWMEKSFRARAEKTKPNASFAASVYLEWNNRGSKICRRRSGATSTVAPPVVRWSIIAISTRSCFITRTFCIRTVSILRGPGRRASSLPRKIFFRPKALASAFSLMLTA